ncbi:MAG: NAD-dependent epimerase/dehydratase family protein [Synergistaceae bacterium]|nr:NAD-dependent epimerase/dehydratase family protein [Synergistaceae bacterium]
MKRIVVTGASGQIGSELVPHLRRIYGAEAVLATDLRPLKGLLAEGGPSASLDVRDGKAFSDLVGAFRADTIIHLAGILSARGEGDFALAWDVNVNGSITALEVAREREAALFFPSSIAAFGPATPPTGTPQDTIQRPTTVYGVAKVSLELLCDYFHLKFGVDTRGLRFPGLISHEAPPGGGTTDYAVHIYHEAVERGRYTSFIAAGTFLDMMYMPDALDAVVGLMEADPSRLIHRNAFNVSAMSLDPEGIAAAIGTILPHFVLDYDVDPLRQAIARSWPDSLDCSAAREEWGFAPRYDLKTMTEDMISRLRARKRKALTA